jgi:ATP-dependent RNA helicase DDX27
MKIIFTLHGEGLERSDELHGDLTQEARLRSLRRFREGECAFLLATDLASRGSVPFHFFPRLRRVLMRNGIDSISRVLRMSSTTRCLVPLRSTSIVSDVPLELVRQDGKSLPPSCLTLLTHHL